MTTVCMNAYVIEAWISMICDANKEPFITINPLLSQREMDLPLEYLNNGFLTLNVSGPATGYVTIEKDSGYLMMSARFNGIERHIQVPLETVIIVSSRCGIISMNTPQELIMMGEQRSQPVQPVQQPIEQSKPEPEPLNGIEAVVVDGDIEYNQPVRPKRQTPKLTIVK